jgi:hypothetical protein
LPAVNPNAVVSSPIFPAIPIGVVLLSGPVGAAPPAPTTIVYRLPPTTAVFPVRYPPAPPPPPTPLDPEPPPPTRRYSTAGGAITGKLLPIWASLWSVNDHISEAELVDGNCAIYEISS